MKTIEKLNGGLIGASLLLMGIALILLIPFVNVAFATRIIESIEDETIAYIMRETNLRRHK